MSQLISFTCDCCEATLSVAVELAGISGPCPYCGETVTSPAAPAPTNSASFRPWPGAVEYVEPAALPAAAEESSGEPEGSRQWLLAHMMSPGEELIHPVKPRRHLLATAATVVAFAGGVTAAYHFWSAPAKQEKAKPVVRPAAPAAKPAAPARPEVLASATESDPAPADTLPAPADDIPAAPVTGTGGVLAANVSTAPSAPATVIPAAPQPQELHSALLPDLPPEPAITAEMTAAEQEIRKVIATGGHLEKPGTALVKFFAAPTWQDRLPWVLAPDVMKPQMEAYYKSAKDGPLIPDSVGLNNIESTEEDPDRKYYSYVAFFPDVPGPIPMTVEDTKAGCKVEWRTFIECKDRLLEKFCEAYTPEPATLRVSIRRGHYFDKDVPAQDRKVVFDVLAPDQTGPYKVWLDKDSVNYTRHFASGVRSRWEILSRMVLTLQWEKTQDGAAFVRLREVVADNWHPELLPAQKKRK